MLLSLLFHRIDANKIDSLEKLFQTIAKNYPTILPDDPIEKKRLSICLSFDDGTFDFYTHVYPLLKKYGLKALLAISPSFSLETSDMKKDLRLSHNLELKQSACYCTWDEIKTMDLSSHVQIASHGFSHKNLILPNIDLHQEIVESKQLIEERLGHPINTFVYPYGKFNKKVHQMTKSHYSTIMRIGSSINFSWQNHHRLTYRVASDSFGQIFSKQQFVSYLFRYLINSVKGR